MGFVGEKGEQGKKLLRDAGLVSFRNPHGCQVQQEGWLRFFDGFDLVGCIKINKAEVGKITSFIHIGGANICGWPCRRYGEKAHAMATNPRHRF
jgi:hypothetical protein